MEEMLQEMLRDCERYRKLRSANELVVLKVGMYDSAQIISDADLDGFLDDLIDEDLVEEDDDDEYEDVDWDSWEEWVEDEDKQ